MSTSAPTLNGLKAGDARWWFGMLAIVRASSADTGGAYTLLEVRAPAGFGAPLHVHHTEDEGFHVLEGSIDVTVGDDAPVHLEAGDFAFGPREVPHRFDAGPAGARMLWVLSPGGFEDLVEATSVPAAELTLPPADVVPPPDAGEIVSRYGNELL